MSLDAPLGRFLTVVGITLVAIGTSLFTAGLSDERPSSVLTAMGGFMISAGAILIVEAP